MSDNAFAKYIPCPEHPTGRAGIFGRKHQAILFCYPGQFAGIWECPVSGSSDSCEHNPENYTVEEIENMSPDPDSSYYWVSKVYVCGDCNCTIDSDVADPEVDRAEALADMQIMEALGK